MISRYLFGDDIFISYTRVDAIYYAAGLANYLASKDLSCYLDQWGASPDRELPASLKRALKRSSAFVLIGTEQAVSSRAVEIEVREFLKTKRTLIPIDFEGVLERASWYPLIAGAARTPESNVTLNTGQPSERVRIRVEKTLQFTRRNQRVRRSFVIASVLLSIFLGVSIYASVNARQQQRLSEAASTQAKEQEQIARENAGRAAQQEGIANQNAARATEQENLAKKNLTRAQEQETLALKNAAEAKRQLELYVKERATKQSLELAEESQKRGKTILQSLGLAIQAEEKAPTASAQSAVKATIEKLLGEFRVRPSEIVTSPDGLKIVVISPFNNAVLFNTKTKHSLPICGDILAPTLAFSPNSQYLVTGAGGVLHIWDTDSEILKGNWSILGSTELKGGYGWFSPDSRYFISSTYGNLLLFEIPSGKLVKELEDTSHHIEVVFDTHSPLFLTRSSSTLCLWNRMGEKVWSSQVKDRFEFVTYASQAKSLVGLVDTDTDSGTPQYFLVVELGENRQPKSEKRIKFDEFDYKLLVNTSVDLGGIVLRESLAKLLKDKYPDVAGRIGFNAIYPNKSWTMAIATHTSFDGPRVVLFSLSTLENLGPLDGWDDGDADEVEFSSNEAVFVLKIRKCSDEGCDSRISVWSVSERKHLWTSSAGVEGFRLSWDGTRLVTWSRSSEPAKSEMEVYDAMTGHKISHLEHDAEPITSGVAISPTDLLGPVFIGKGAKYSVTRTEHTAYLWNGETGELLNKINLFKNDKQQFQSDMETVSKSTKPEELLEIAKRRSKPCPSSDTSKSSVPD